MTTADLTVMYSAKEYSIGGSVTPRAVGTLTGTANFADTQTVTIDGKVYTFQDTLTNVNGNVKIGANLAATLLNLLHAIKLSGGIAGTDYAAAMTAHTTVDGVSADATHVYVRAKTGGTAGNALATTETLTNGSWGAATLTGGTAGPALSQIRYTGESLNFNIENTKTAEIRPDRTETDLIQTGAAASGDINFELSYGTFTEFLAAALCSSWVPDTGDITILKNGQTLASYLIQKYFQDMDVPEYHNYFGACIEGFNIKMEIGKIVEGSFNVMALGLTRATAQIASATFPTVSDTTPMNAVTNVQNLTIDGVPYSGCINKLGMQVKNGIRAIKCLGSLNAQRMNLGTLEVTGDMEFYFNEGSIYQKFVEGTEFAFAFDLEDGDGNVYTFTLPRAKFETGEVVAGGRNSDVMFSAKWRGLYDTSAGCVMSITANPV